MPPSFCSRASSDSDYGHWSCEMSKWSCEHVIVDQIAGHTTKQCKLRGLKPVFVPLYPEPAVMEYEGQCLQCVPLYPEPAVMKYEGQCLQCVPLYPEPAVMKYEGNVSSVCLSILNLL